MRKERVVQIRLTDGERDALGALAEGAGLSLSAWVRRRLGLDGGVGVVQERVLDVVAPEPSAPQVGPTGHRDGVASVSTVGMTQEEAERVLFESDDGSTAEEKVMQARAREGWDEKRRLAAARYKVFGKTEAEKEASLQRLADLGLMGGKDGGGDLDEGLERNS